VFARASLGFAKLAFQPRGARPAVMGHASPGGWELIRDPRMREVVEKNAWPVFASVSWALVMWLFKWHPDVVQPSMRSSMTYMWVLPFELFTGLESYSMVSMVV
jgi:hypothetical protein